MSEGRKRSITVNGRRYTCPPNLQRVDTTHGNYTGGGGYWMVRIERRGFRHVRYFPDAKHGGTAAAFYAAAGDCVLAQGRAPTIRTCSHHHQRENRSKRLPLGFPGVFFTCQSDRNRARISVHWAGGNYRRVPLPALDALTPEALMRALLRAAALRLESEARSPSRGRWTVPAYSGDQLDALAAGPWRADIAARLSAPEFHEALKYLRARA
jgi:hypothetical protein